RGPVNTATLAVPTDATAAAAIVACTLCVLTTVVGWLTPFNWTTENALKPLPLTVSGNAVEPAGTRAGDNAVAIGGGFTTGVSDASAAYIRIRGAVTVPPALVSVTDRPVWRSAFRMVLTLPVGTASLLTGH